jgi:hypothetical protein
MVDRDVRRPPVEVFDRIPPVTHGVANQLIASRIAVAGLLRSAADSLGARVDGALNTGSEAEAARSNRVGRIAVLCAVTPLRGQK